jgi:hypothetical protein
MSAADKFLLYMLKSLSPIEQILWHADPLLGNDRLYKSFLYCPLVMLTTPLDAAKPQAQDTVSQLQDVIVAATANLCNGEIREFEELIAEYEEVSATKSSDYGQTDRMYHHTDV